MRSIKFRGDPCVTSFVVYKLLYLVKEWEERLLKLITYVSSEFEIVMDLVWRFWPTQNVHSQNSRGFEAI